MAKAKTVIYLFDKSLVNMVLKPEHEVIVDDEGTMETWRLVKGDSTLNIKKQRPNAVVNRFRVGTQKMVISDATTQKWLESKPYFGTKIKIYDQAQENKKQLESVMANVNTVLKVSKLNNEELLGLGYQVFGQKALNMVKDEQSYDGLTMQLLAKANNEADVIENLLDKENKSSSTWWALAFAKGIIKEDQSGTKVSWGDNHGGAEIISVTVGMKPIDALTEYATTQEGATLKQMIGQKMVEKANATNAKVITETAADDEVEEEVSEYPDKLVDMKEFAKQKGYNVEEYVEINRKDKMVEYLDSKKTGE